MTSHLDPGSSIMERSVKCCLLPTSSHTPFFKKMVVFRQARASWTKNVEDSFSFLLDLAVFKYFKCGLRTFPILKQFFVLVCFKDSRFQFRYEVYDTLRAISPQQRDKHIHLWKEAEFEPEAQQSRSWFSTAFLGILMDIPLNTFENSCHS